MTEQRPQYGEIATPEEQRRAAGLPPVVDLPSADDTTMPPVTREPAAKRPHPVDRIVTVALLAYGLINVAMSAVSYLDPSRVMNEAMTILGVSGEFTNFAEGKLWGTIAAVVLIVGYAITAILSVRRLRRGRITWWLPLVGAIVTVGIASMCIAVPMFGDPAFVAHMNDLAAP